MSNSVAVSCTCICESYVSCNNGLVAIAFSTIAITHLYIISILIAIMSIVKPCLQLTMKYIHSCYIYHSMTIVVICWLHTVDPDVQESQACPQTQYF